MCIRNLVKCQKSFFNLDKLSKKLSRYEKTVNYSSMKTCKLLDCYIVLQVLGFYLQGGPILHKTSGEHTVWMSVQQCICESVFVSGLHCQYGTLCAYFCVFFVLCWANMEHVFKNQFQIRNSLQFHNCAQHHGAGDIRLHACHFTTCYLWSCHWEVPCRQDQEQGV